MRLSIERGVWSDREKEKPLSASPTQLVIDARAVGSGEDACVSLIGWHSSEVSSVAACGCSTVSSVIDSITADSSDASAVSIAGMLGSSDAASSATFDVDADVSTVSASFSVCSLISSCPGCSLAFSAASDDAKA